MKVVMIGATHNRICLDAVRKVLSEEGFSVISIDKDNQKINVSPGEHEIKLIEAVNSKSFLDFTEGVIHLDPPLKNEQEVTLSYSTYSQPLTKSKEAKEITKDPNIKGRRPKWMKKDFTY